MLQILPKKHRYVFLSSALFLVVSLFLIHIFSLVDINDESFLDISQVLSALQYGYSFTIITAWFSESFVFLSVIVLLILFFILLIAVKTEISIFLFSGIYFLTLVITLLYFYKRNSELCISTRLDIEKIEEMTNIVEKEIEHNTAALETLLETCSHYSGLRDVIEKFSSTLSLNVLNNIIVKSVFDVIKNSELVLLYLADEDENALSLVASKSLPGIDWKKDLKKGDIFDNWVIKQGYPLIIKNLRSDVRFDKELSIFGDTFLSVIAAPIMVQGKPLGSLRVNSRSGDAFNLEDCRIFSIISDVASAAINNAILYKKTEELAIRDSLTGLYVYRYFRQRFKEEHRRFLMRGGNISLVMIDFDDFKKLNDSYGHTAGDIVLRKIASVIVNIVGERGIVARYGGEEIAVILPDTGIDESLNLAKKICVSVEGEGFDFRGDRVNVTVSIGVASMPDDALDIEGLIHVADKRLYSAKRAGKNRAVCSDEKK